MTKHEMARVFVNQYDERHCQEGLKIDAMGELIDEGHCCTCVYHEGFHPVSEKNDEIQVVQK